MAAPRPVVYVRHASEARWCAAHVTATGHATTACGVTVLSLADWEIADARPPLGDRCRRCEPSAPVQVGLRELAACAVDVDFDCYERLAARATELGTTPEAVADDVIDQALDAEMRTS